MFYTYILKSKKNGKLYTGYTSDLRKRFKEHNKGRSTYTKKNIPYELIYYEACKEKEDAMNREKYLKSGRGKRFIKARLKRFLFRTGLISFLILFSGHYAYGALTCSVANVCNSPDTVIFKISGNSNAHAELQSQSNYSKYICCSGVSGIGNSCSGTSVAVARLSGITNAHVEENTQSNYGNNACLSISSGTVSVGYQDNNCTGYQTTVASISGQTNAQVGDANTYTKKICASATATVTPPSGGGGGGGGGGITPPVVTTGITFSGRAYPLSHITILKDGQVAITTIAGPDASFSVTLNNLSTGNYNFSVYGEDNAGNRSTLFTFPTYFTYGSNSVIGGIFLAPTIDVDKSEVKKGDNIAIFGQTAPSSDVTISVHSSQEFFKQTTSDTNGAYLYNFDTVPLEYGNHNTKSKTTLQNEITSFGKTVSFLVGSKNTPKATTEGCSTKGDLNNDCRVNLIDFSIMAFWYKKPSPPIKVDLNNDAQVNLVDFSILAYNWTG
ncbi:MAG: GIY-YIG nuclease family protein [Minisyncoccia bacterium]